MKVCSSFISTFAYSISTALFFPEKGLEKYYSVLRCNPIRRRIFFLGNSLEKKVEEGEDEKEPKKEEEEGSRFTVNCCSPPPSSRRWGKYPPHRFFGVGRHRFSEIT